jgi:hypothetical protein
VRTWGLLLVAAAVFVVVWLALHPALPQLPNGDVYTSLGVARHLANGNGLVNDSIYPLFTVYPWGQTAPQPLIHRPPGLAVLLLPAWYLAGGDPEGTEALVRPLMAVILGLGALLGLIMLQRLGQGHAGGALLLLLLVNPLLALAVHWGWSEIPCAVILMVLWFVMRRRQPADLPVIGAAGYALLSGALAMIRGDVLWVPVLWWFAVGLADRRRRWRAFLVRTVVAGVVGVATLLPWWLHVTGHSGTPLANPLTEAVQLDLSEEWWDYPLLRGRDPVPLAENLQENAVPAVKKIAVGLRGYARTLGAWLPWLAWMACVPLWLTQSWRRVGRGYRLDRAVGPVGLLMVTLALMAVQYAFFSPETRHMLPILIIVAWEFVRLMDLSLRRLPGRVARGAAMTAMAAVALLLSPPGLGGEQGNVETARELVAVVTEETARARQLPPGPVFSDNAVVPWRAARAYVWSPFDGEVEAQIRATVAGMADAPWVRILPAGGIHHQTPPSEDP